MPPPRCDVRLDASSVDYIDVTWTVGDARVSALTYTFQVLRGESSGGPFEPVTERLSDRYHIRDYIAPRRMHWRDLYYVVRTEDGSGEVVDSEPVSLRARPPLDALEMIRLNSLLFKEYVGRPCLIYALRTFGERCTQCYDAVTQRRLVGSCRNCYGTSFIRGYHYPQYAYVQIEPEQQRTTQTQEAMKTQQATTTARMSIYPLVKVGDLLVEREGVRHRVLNVAHTERLRAPVQQILSLYRITPNDIEYQIPVQWRDDIETSPRSYKTESDL